MKRIFPAILMIIAAAGAQAETALSAGLGIRLAMTAESEKYVAGADWVRYSYEYPALRAEAYLDAGYAFLSAGIWRNSSDATHRIKHESGYGDSVSYNAFIGSYLSVAAFMKIPFKVNVATLYPMAGAEYCVNLSYEDSDGANIKSLMSDDIKKGLDQLWLKAGIGMDFPALIDGAYIRTTATAGYKLPSAYDMLTIHYNANDLAAAYGLYSCLQFDLGLAIGFNF